uniref:Uncharacterized protein n=1 Tax=Timema douglasi TaxID=61478 RepID=A0A7R8ZGZ9_TIMDO|nr:unnamed protein product [Timema douglasi]
MDEVEDFPDDLAYDSDEEEYDALNDETFGSDAIGDEDWEQSHEVLAGLSQDQNELEARLATLWQDEEHIPQLANAPVVWSSTAEDGGIEVRISVG